MVLIQVALGTFCCCHINVECWRISEFHVLMKPLFFRFVNLAMAPVSSCDCPHLDCVGEVTKEELIQKSHVCNPQSPSSPLALSLIFSAFDLTVLVKH